MQATDQALDPVLNTDNCESDAAPRSHALFIIPTRRGDGFNASIHGHMLKLVNNFIAMSIATATAEACAACAKAGVSIRKLHEIVSAGGVNSGIFQMMVGKMLESGDLSGLKFTLSNAMKDLRYYTHFVEALPSPAIIGEAVHQSMVNANILGFGDKYVASLLEAQEKLGGVNIVRQ